MTDKLMKGQTWEKGKRRLTYPVVGEIKYDEIRCDVRRELGRVPLFQSWADKPLANMERFHLPFNMLMQRKGLDRIDCGVLVNRSYDSSYRWVRSTKKLPADLVDANVEFVLFDVPQWGQIGFMERKFLLDELTREAVVTFGINMIRPIRQTLKDEQSVDEYFEQATLMGYEGLMVKALDHTYQIGKRSFDWLKYKPEETADGTITAVNEAISEAGIPLGRAGSLDVVLEDGSTTSVAGIAHDLGALMLADPSRFIGEGCEFVYMMRDRQGGYRHPRFKRIREAKS